MRFSCHAGWRGLLGIAASLLAAIPAVAQPVDTDYPPGTLDLPKVVRMTLERDPNIALARENVRQNEGALRQSSGKFDNIFSLGQSVGRTSTTYVSPDPTLPKYYSTDTTQTSLSSSWLLRSGQTLATQVGLTRTAYEEWLGLGVQNTGIVSFAITQPLLRGRRGAGVTAAERSAEMTLESTAWALRHTISERIRSAAVAFFNLVAAVEDLGTRTSQEANALELLEAMRRLGEAGERPRSDAVPLEADFHERATDRIRAAQGVAKARYDLGIAIGIPYEEIRDLPLPGAALRKFDLATIPAAAETGRYVKEALRRRLDLKARAASRQAAEALLDGSRDAMKPRADVALSGGYQGFGSSWGFSNYFAPLKPSGAPLTFAASLSVEIPTTNAAAKGAFVAQEAVLRQSRIQESDLQSLVGARVGASLAELRGYALQYGSNVKALEAHRLAEANEQRRVKGGLATVSSLVQLRNYTVSATSAELSSRLNVVRSLIGLRFEMGAILTGAEGFESVDLERIVSVPPVGEGGK